jgi:hypothetical protein
LETVQFTHKIKPAASAIKRALVVQMHHSSANRCFRTILKQIPLWGSAFR